MEFKSFTLSSHFVVANNLLEIVYEPEYLVINQQIHVTNSLMNGVI